VSESREDGQPGGGQPRTSNNQPGNGGQPRPNGQSGGSQSRRASDPLADAQRWLLRAGARSMANQVADQVRRTIGQDRRDRGDVWDTATNEPPPGESPECQWCPICQAARAARVGGSGGLISSLADAGGALASMAQDAFSAFDQILKTQNQNQNRSSTERPVVKPPAVTPPATKPDNGESTQ
jgi:hypothetical protein